MLRCVSLRWSTIHDKDESAVTKDRLIIETKVYVGEGLEVKKFGAIHAVVYVVNGSYNTILLQSALSKPYHQIYLKHSVQMICLNRELHKVMDKLKQLARRGSPRVCKNCGCSVHQLVAARLGEYLCVRAQE